MSDVAHTQTDALLTEMERKVRAEYEQAAKDMYDKLYDYLDGFARRDARKLGQVIDGKITQEQYNQWRLGQVMVSQRWQEMLDTLTEDLENARNISRSIVEGYQPEVYALNHNFSTFQVEKDSLVDTSYTMYDSQTVERLLRDNPQLLPPLNPKGRVAKAIQEQKIKAWDKQKVTSAVTQGILQGESNQDIAKRIAGVADMLYKSDAIRYARTMTTEAESAGREDAYKRAEKMGIKMRQQWIATLDSRTRHSHRQLDGEIQDVGDKFSNGCEYPGDPGGPPAEVWNCRCTLIGVVDGVDYEVSDVNNRNSKLGDMTYEEWQDTKEEDIKRKEEDQQKKEEARRQREEEQKRQEEERKKQEEEARRKQEEEAKRQREEEIRKQQAEEARKRQEEERKKKEAAPSAVERVQRIVSEHKGEWSVQELQEAGKIVREEIQRRVDERIAPVKDKYYEIKAKIEEEKKIQEEHSHILDKALADKNAGLISDAQYREMREEQYRYINAAYSNIFKLENEIDKMEPPKHEIFKELLGEIRPLCNINNKNAYDYFEKPDKQVKKLTDLMIQALGCYPQSWVDKARVVTKKGFQPIWTEGRANYRGHGLLYTNDHHGAATIHEIGHGFEELVGGILSSEHSFYEKRTKGLKLEWLGQPYAKKEKGRKDDFVHKYMGKEYEDHDAYELVSMGFEMVFTDEYKRLERDEDMQTWIFGLLSCIE